MHGNGDELSIQTVVHLLTYQSVSHDNNCCQRFYYNFSNSILDLQLQKERKRINMITIVTQCYIIESKDIYYWPKYNL